MPTLVPLRILRPQIVSSSSATRVESSRSSAVGWENREVASFLDRSAGHFDCILALGLMHHLLVSERATLGMLAELFDRLNPKRLLVEWVDPKDEKFQQLASINQALYSGLDAAAMEACLGSGFRLISKLILPCGTRVMYLWSR